MNKTAELALVSSLVLPTLGAGAGAAQAGIQQAAFGQTKDGATAELWTLTNRHGVQVKITNYGGAVVALLVPDRHGKLDDVVLGFDSAAGYESGTSYLGALVGRYGNRIAKGVFQLDGHRYPLAVNNGANHLHGGLKGFNRVLWQGKVQPATAEGEHLELSYVSADGEEGYPGKLSVQVTYTLTDDATLRIVYRATTDRPTVVNLTNHSYFNLAGAHTATILEHEVKLNAEKFTPVDATQIPTGELRPVAGTPFDFRSPHRIGERIGASDEQLRIGHGYDHNFVVDGPLGTLRQAAEVYEPTSGRTMAVWTTQPGVQFYTGNFLDGKQIGKQHVAYQQRYGFCLETQHFPDTPNKPRFPTAVLRPGQVYLETTEYRFGVDRR